MKERLTFKDKYGYWYDEDKVILSGFLNKLGQLEDILEKYGIEDLQVLDQILQVHKFLLEHEYSTLPREDFDLLFKKLKALEIIKEFDLMPSDIVVFTDYNEFMNNSYLAYNESIQDFFNKGGKAPTRQEYDLLKEELL